MNNNEDVLNRIIDAVRACEGAFTAYLLTDTAGRKLEEPWVGSALVMNYYSNFHFAAYSICSFLGIDSSQFLRKYRFSYPPFNDMVFLDANEFHTYLEKNRSALVFKVESARKMAEIANGIKSFDQYVHELEEASALIYRNYQNLKYSN